DRYSAAEPTASSTHAPAVVTTYEAAPAYIYPSHPSYQCDESRWINHSLRFGDNDDNRAYNDPR
ncbi:MAG TPA: hypothetical protein VKX17_20920, partial [Planctomycetota bacterium]|nr:hypothetical protein [Planctomycetota bacterium]